jgi:hypothetical protein
MLLRFELLKPQGFILRPHAAGAEVEVPGFPVDVNSGGVNIGGPAPVGMAFGMADVMAEKRRFSANITLHLKLS